MALAALDRFAEALPNGPVVVVYSSFMWDIGRLMELHPTTLNRTSGSYPAWVQRSRSWQPEYEANFTATSQAVRQRLLSLPRHGQPASANALLLLADYGCGGHLANVCGLYAPIAAQSVRRASVALGLPLVDLHQMNGPDMIMREYAYPPHTQCPT